MLPVSAFIIAKNEESRIEKAITSLKSIAREIIVIDSGSTDNTVDIAKNLGAKVVFNEWPGYVAQKSFGEQLCKNDWIINIDADEELTPILQDEIKLFFSSNQFQDFDACYINVVILHRNDLKARPMAPFNKVVRIYNRNHCSFSNTKNSTTQDAVTFNNDADHTKIFSFKQPAYHRSGTSIAQLIDKANFYSSEQSKDLIAIKRRPSNIRIFFELPLCFFKAFFLRRYFVFGFDGFIDSIIFAFARFARLAKAREKNIVRNEMINKK